MLSLMEKMAKSLDIYWFIVLEKICPSQPKIVLKPSQLCLSIQGPSLPLPLLHQALVLASSSNTPQCYYLTAVITLEQNWYILHPFPHFFVFSFTSPSSWNDFCFSLFFPAHIISTNHFLSVFLIIALCLSLYHTSFLTPLMPPMILNSLSYLLSHIAFYSPLLLYFYISPTTPTPCTLIFLILNHSLTFSLSMLVFS